VNSAGTLQRGYNISSVTRTGAGMYSLIFSNYFPNTLYTVTATNNSGAGRIAFADDNFKSISSFRVYTVNSADYGSANDANFSVIVV
jgi:hypothetical protein